MSADAGYMLIRVDLQGAQQAAAEAKVVQGAIAGTAAQATAANAATSTGTRRASQARSVWQSLGKAIKFAGLGMAAGFAAVVVVAKKSIDATKELGLVAAGLRRNLGLTAEEGSRWAAIASARNIAPTSLNMAFKTLSNTFNEAAKGEDTYVELLKTIGVSQEEAKGGLKDFDSIITMVAEGLGDMEGGAERQAAAAKLLGRGYQTILPMFSDGAKGLQEYLKWADKYNVTMGDDMVDSTVELANAERESKVALQGVQIAIAREFMPTLIDLHRKWQAFAADMTDPTLTRDQKIDIIRKKFEKLANLAGKAISAIIPVAVKHMTENAPKVAGAFISGFIQADAWGRLIVGGWLAAKFAFMLGSKGFFAKAGGASGRFFVLGLITLGLVTFGPEIFAWAKEQGEKFKDIGYELGYKLGHALIDALNKAIELLNQVNPFGDIGKIEPGGFLPPSVQDALADPNAVVTPAGVAPIDPATGLPESIPTGLFPGQGGGGGGRGGGGGSHGGGGHANTPKGPGDLPRGASVSGQGGGSGKVGDTSTIILQVDGKKMAEVVHEHAQRDRARR